MSSSREFTLGLSSSLSDMTVSLLAERVSERTSDRLDEWIGQCQFLPPDSEFSSASESDGAVVHGERGKGNSAKDEPSTALRGRSVRCRGDGRLPLQPRADPEDARRRDHGRPQPRVTRGGGERLCSIGVEQVVHVEESHDAHSFDAKRFLGAHVDERDVGRPIGRDRFGFDGRAPIVERLNEGARERRAGLMSDDGDDQKVPGKIDRAVQFRLPRPEPILIARGVDQGIRREIIARPKGGLVAPRLA